MQATNRLRPILVVEDSPEDFEVLQRAFRKAEILLPLLRCVDGDDALDFLYVRGDYTPETAPPPALVVLDLNMPGTDGFGVLERIKTDDALMQIPTVVLSTSRSEEDVRRAYKSGANSYISKPVDMSGYVRMAELLKSYWFECSVLATQ
jgi:CheY-like chemotaxis protein